GPATPAGAVRSAEQDEAVKDVPPPAPLTPPRAALPAAAEPPVALRPAGPSAVSLFWWSTLVLTLIGLFLGAASQRAGDSLVVSLVILWLIRPALQPGAFVVAFLILAFSSRPGKDFQRRQLGKIGCGLIAGTAAGIAAMALIFFVCTLR